MRKIRLTLEYDGTRYAGWQSQKARPGVRTIQEELEDKIKRLLKSEEASLICAGRTDAGVHALGQVAAFRAHAGFSLTSDVIKKAINSMVPEDIRVLEAADCPHDFHPRHDALKKTYFYILALTPYPPVFIRRYAWEIPWRLDIEAMRAASALMIGKRDFSSFRASGCGSKTPVKEIFSIEITPLEEIGFLTSGFKGDYLRISITADAFLRHMCRNIVGTLVLVGRGKIKPDEIGPVIESRDRRLAGPTAPARGLFLERVYY
ncbi:MAG: tRNA pseudouridine(38-40) synthase TruA [Nitrospiraceae bacterium]|nr:tRNA pseudouridine(38-40) synthase TruA [Nitrospiraceae bacterium]